MSAGASLLTLFGGKDPREELMQALMARGGAAAGGAQQPAGGGTYAGGAAAGAGTAAQPAADGTGVQAMAESPDGLKSPPDLAGLYANLLKFNNKSANMDRGLGLIGSAISQDGNREATLSAFTGDKAPNASAGMDSIASSILDFNKQNIATQQRAAQLASLGAIAKKYNLTPETARYLMETGKLEEVIAEAEKPNRELREQADGTIALIDKNSGGMVGSFGMPADTRTDDEKEFERSQRTPDFKDYQLDMKRAGASQNNTNVNMDPGEKALDTELGKLDAEAVRGYRDQAKNATGQLDMLDLVEQGLNSGVSTGKLGEFELSMRKFGQAIGLDTDPTKIAGGELVKAVQNKMALQMRNPESGMGMPGSVSDRDLQFLKEAQVGIDTSAEGNKALMEAYRRLEKRKIQVASMAEDYLRQNRSMAGFEGVVREYAEKNPLFTPENFKVGTPSSDDRRKALRSKYGIN